ncbi:ABC-type multidrug transport system, ATPase and permease component [Actinoalloteichus sp. GBA129-24]|uniref:ABC-type multidrug transport system, ATPase and permease component n=2 Tax=Pseudonocardiaceae TaxID=2070 RepID=A0AAC9PQK3_9PSEU|nr:ABC-type multidrug transport system, ATPase and permease component [Actinoalloteichus fjordicus]APU19054.1 ABC-type multidrug transport system, ATPase and permease component [Actinoalloteichus sp. GBA129-24]
MRRIPELGAQAIDHRSAARYLLWLVSRQKASTAWGMVTSAVWNASQAFIPVALGQALDLGITGRDSGALIYWSGVILLLGVVRAAAGIAFYRQTVISRTVSAGLTVQAVTRHVTKLGGSLSRGQDVGNLTATVTSDVTTIGNGLLHAGRFLGSIVAVIVVTIFMLTISVPLGLMVLVMVPALLVLSGLLLRPLHRNQDEYRSQQGRLSARAVDIAAGLRVLRGVGGEKQFSTAFHTDSAQLRVADTKVAQAEANLDGARVLMPGLIAAIATYTAARFALDQQVTVGQMVSFYAFAVFLTLPLNDIMEGAKQVTRALVSASRVTALLNTEAPDRARSTVAAENKGAAHLVDRTSGLEVPPSTLLAVVCADSSTADPLARRLARFGDSGDVTLDGEPLASLPLAVVRSRVLLARNSDRFFGGTIQHEIAPSETTTPEELAAALEVSCAADIIDSLPNGSDTQMRGRGRTFSGGELQRLRLARAILADADVTLLVEPTNAVDAYTEHTIATNLARHHEALPDSRSMVVFTVSPLLLQQAGLVAYVVDGRVTATGSHKELLATHAEYRDLVRRNDALEAGR